MNVQDWLVVYAMNESSFILGDLGLSMCCCFLQSDGLLLALNLGLQVGVTRGS